jgi:sulfide:quinone oxidoreductase
MTNITPHSGRLRVVIAGGGVAALETALALKHLAPGHIDVTILAPNAEFIYRPLAVREPFAYGAATRYPLQRIAGDAGAELRVGELAWIDPDRRTLHTEAGSAIEYDALVLALGARARARYEHAVTIDDRNLDEKLHGLIQDIEGDYVHSVAFVSPGRMAWPLPLYELALMTAARAYDMGIELATTIITPEDSPLAIFGAAASNAVAELLAGANIQSINSAYVEVPDSGEVVINPGDRKLRVDRVIALPELYGPAVRGLPSGDDGFIRIDRNCQVPGAGPIFAAGDATEFPIKFGGIASQQADTAACAIAALAGVAVTPQPFEPVVRGMLLTGAKPLYLTASITGGHGFSSRVSDTPSSAPPAKIAAKYLAPYLETRDREAELSPAS